MQQIQSTLSSKYQVVVPAQIRRALKVTAGDQILWRIAHLNDQVKAVAEPMPKEWGSYMRGLGRDLWKRVSIAQYIDSLRNEWQPA